MRLTADEIKSIETQELFLWWSSLTRQERIKTILDPQYKTAVNRLMAALITDNLVEATH